VAICSSEDTDAKNVLSVMDYTCECILDRCRTFSFTFVSSVYLRCGQHTETMVHAMIDCQSVRPSWVNVLSFISDQVDPMPDADAILQLRLPIDMHTHLSTKPVPLVLTCSL
jgi:hypothetical protein